MPCEGVCNPVFTAGTKFKATAVKRLPPLGSIFTAAPGSWDGGVGCCGRSARAWGAAGGRGGAWGVPVALGSSLAVARADVPWVPMDPDPPSPIWLQIWGGLKRPLGRL